MDGIKQRVSWLANANITKRKVDEDLCKKINFDDVVVYKVEYMVLNVSVETTQVV